MKTLIATVAFADLIAAPAFAEALVKQAPAVSPNAVTTAGGRVIGMDPDPFVRFEILRDASKPYK